MDKKKQSIVISMCMILIFVFGIIVKYSYDSFTNIKEENRKQMEEVGDDLLAFYIDGELANSMPLKGYGYMFSNESNCNNGVTIEWDDSNWKANLDFSTFNMIGTTRTKCNLYFKKRTEPGTLKKGGSSISGGLWDNKSDITTIVIQNELKPIDDAVEIYDESEAQDGSVMSYLVPNENDSYYTAYLQSQNKLYLNSDSSYLFANFSELNDIQGLEYIDTSNVTDMSYMFHEANSITSLNLNNWNTKNVTNMNNMFRKAKKLTSIALSDWNTENVIDMSYMFCEANSLTSLNLNNWNTKKVINMSHMFYYLENIINLELSNWDTSNVTNMSYMFYRANSLTSLDFNNWNTSSVTTMNYMFYYASKLNSITYGSKFIYANSATIRYMFNNCPANKPTDSSWNGKF